MNSLLIICFRRKRKARNIYCCTLFNCARISNFSNEIIFGTGNPRPGISGGPILNDQGEVIGIYGKAEYGKSE
ncbi:MAG: hypothetical protein ACKPDM_03745, partial [Dolichospermum sp.]